MKFARYLQDTQTPEWKKVYIDYRGLKAQLGIIRAQIPHHFGTSSPTAVADLDRSRNPVANSKEKCGGSEGTHLGRGGATSARIGSLWVPGADPASSGHIAALPTRRRTTNREKPSLSLAVAGKTSATPSQQTLPPPRTPRSPPTFPVFGDSAGSPIPLPLHSILFNLPATHTRFFNMLDAELEKVEKFYMEREKEMHERARRLREQLNELVIHRQIFYQSSTHARSQNWAEKVQHSAPSTLGSVIQWLQGPNTKPGGTCQIGVTGVLASESGRGTEHVWRSGDHPRPWKKEGVERNEAETDPGDTLGNDTASSQNAPDESARSPPNQSNSLSGAKHPLDPHEYQHAKRRLRKAVIEHYRGLAVLNNYRILNLTGFRKALKKYEKITKNSVLDAYTKEKVEPSAFASDALVSTMLKETEDLFAMRFERGDRKKALDRLRVGQFSKTHHFSTFRSGLWLGLALPAVIEGFHLSFQEHVRESLPSWNILLYVYSIFLVPVLLALLIGINIAVWAREKINYVFIFGLNPRSRLDHHEYFELPSLLLCTLAFAFWLSLAQIGSPMLWPLIWVAFSLAVMFNPIHRFMWGHSRWWTIKNIAKLGASGVWKVEFADFWLGDQLCSLHYSFSNLFFVGCFYTRFVPNTSISTIPTQGQEAWAICGSTRNWGWYYILGTLPFLVRLIQSLRRYRDSKLHTHLINAGKYGMGAIYYFCYYYWRHQESPRVGASYILLCFTASAYAIYACAWDFLMDWSLCKPHAQYPLLRQELIFETQIPSYYFALISNLCIRFLWLAYVPASGLNATLCAFIISMLEMLRRVQWNFYRLENEHLGNMDQYRVTREVPLPYNFEMHSNEEEEEEEHEEGHGESWWKRRVAWLRGNRGHG